MIKQLTEEQVKEINIKLHTGHCNWLDICPNCVAILGREKVKELICKATLNKISIQQDMMRTHGSSEHKGYAIAEFEDFKESFQETFNFYLNSIKEVQEKSQ